ncbi:MAG: OmpA family protein [Pseudomonadota bacterium]|nr:OmpA family protein [Pseudomonadota bacterium]
MKLRPFLLFFLFFTVKLHATESPLPVLEWSKPDVLKLLEHSVNQFDQGYYVDSVEGNKINKTLVEGKFEVFKYKITENNMTLHEMRSVLLSAIANNENMNLNYECGDVSFCLDELLKRVLSPKYQKIPLTSRMSWVNFNHASPMGSITTLSGKNFGFINGVMNNGYYFSIIYGRIFNVRPFLIMEIVDPSTEFVGSLRFNSEQFLKESKVTAKSVADVKNTHEPSYIQRYPDSQIYLQKESDVDRFYVATGVKEGKLVVDTLVGTYEGTFLKSLHPSTSHYEIYLNYKDVLLRNEFDILVDCAPNQCIANPLTSSFMSGKHADPGFYKDVNSGGPNSSYLNYKSFLVAKKSIGGKNLYFQIITNKGSASFPARTLVEVIHEQQPKLGLLEFTEKNMQQEMAEKGRVVLDGLYFAHDATELDLEKSKASLETVQSYLVSNPEAQFYVVGHTDNVGTYEYNMTLSAQRAQAVVQVLSNNYGIEKSRLQAVGVGPVAPAAANTLSTADNRRVELVSKL